ncbi:MAG: 50S ribosomal protein L32 [Candidatus Omnitrophota bacterium]
MALPKRRHSNTRTRKRRTHDVLAKPNLSKCKNCGAYILPHRVCKKCGYYNGVQVIIKKEKKKKKT